MIQQTLDDFQFQQSYVIKPQTYINKHHVHAIVLVALPAKTSMAWHCHLTRQISDNSHTIWSRFMLRRHTCWHSQVYVGVLTYIKPEYRHCEYRHFFFKIYHWRSKVNMTIFHHQVISLQVRKADISHGKTNLSLTNMIYKLNLVIPRDRKAIIVSALSLLKRDKCH